MSEAVTLYPASGLAWLLSAMQPRAPEAAPPPDLDAIRTEGWEAGFAAGEASAEAALAPLRLYLAEAAAALHAACAIDRDALRPLLLILVRQLAEAVLLAELRADPAVLAALVTAGLAAVRPAEAATLRCHPDTLAALRPHLPDVAVAVDPGLPRDGFVIAGTDFVIDAALPARLDAVLEAMACP